MKEGWEYKKLGDVCQSDLGKTLNQSKDTGDLYPYLCAVNILWDKIDLSTLKQTRFEKTELERYSVKKGDLLVCEGGDIGRAAIWDRDEVIQYQNALHRIRFNGEILPRFCLLYLRNLKQKGILDHKYGKGVTILHLVKSSLLSIPIPVPSIREQQQIVSELDLLSGVIEKQKAQLEELDKLAQSIFYDMFGDPVANEKGWEMKKLGEECEDMKYGTSRPACENGRYKYLRMGNITLDGHLDLADLKTIDIPEEEVEKCIVRYGDILFNRTNSHELIGKTCMFDLDEPMIIAGYIIRVRLSENLKPIFISIMFNLPSMKKLLRSIAKGAVNQANINSKELASINIIIPPLSLQQEFAAKVEAIEAMKAKVRQSLKEAETLFNSRMDYYFN